METVMVREGTLGLRSTGAGKECRHKMKEPALCGPFKRLWNSRRSALAGFVALVDLVDDVDAAAAAHQLVGPVAAHQGLERIGDFHFGLPETIAGAARPLPLAASIGENPCPVNASGLFRDLRLVRRIEVK